MNTTDTTAMPNANAPAIQRDVKRWRCPACGGTRLRSYRTTDLGDGSQTRYSRCQGCGQRLVLLVDWGIDEILPTVGNAFS